MKRLLLSLAMLLLPTAALAGDYELDAVGIGTVQATPDEGYVTVSVTTVAADAGTALRENTATASKLYKSLEEFSIERKNVKTLDFSVADHFREEAVEVPPGSPPTTRVVKDGFQVTNTVRITVCDLAQFGGVLDSVVKDGATAVSNIAFGSSKADQLLTKARAAAVEDAVRKANTIAAGLGVRLQGVKRVAEQQQYHRPQAAYARADVRESAGDVPVSGGSLSYSVQVNVTFDIH